MSQVKPAEAAISPCQEPLRPDNPHPRNDLVFRGGSLAENFQSYLVEFFRATSERTITQSYDLGNLTIYLVPPPGLNAHAVGDVMDTV